MKLVPFPHCCTAKILAGFGETDTADYRARPETFYTEESMFKEIVDKLEEAHRAGQAMVFATTNSEQKTANAVLPRVGFEKIEATAKANHSDLQLLGWVFRLNLADKVRPLKVPKNPFTKGEKAAPNPALQFGDEDGEENPFDEVNMRRIFRPAPPQVNPAPPFMAAELYGPLTEPLQQGQVWEQFIPTVGEWITIAWEPTVGDIPQDKQFRIRVGRVRGELDWYEIHPNDQGRVNMAAVSPAVELRVRLFASHDAARPSLRRDAWSWELDQERRISACVITHFKVG